MATLTWQRHICTSAAESALERALDLAEPNGSLTPFLLNPAPGLLERHARHRTTQPP